LHLQFSISVLTSYLSTDLGECQTAKQPAKKINKVLKETEHDVERQGQQRVAEEKGLHAVHGSGQRLSWPPPRSKALIIASQPAS